MISLLAKLFIKNRNDVENPVVRQAYGMLCGLVGIGLNLVLFVSKYVAGTLACSIAITADAMNNLSDAGSSVITLVGFKLAGKRNDAQHPFGQRHDCDLIAPPQPFRFAHGFSLLKL